MSVWWWLAAAAVQAVACVGPPVARLRDDYRWLQVRSLAAFWDEQGVGSASSAWASLLSSVAGMRADLVLVVRRQGADLRFWLGVADQLGQRDPDVLLRSVQALIGSLLPDAKVRAPDPAMVAQDVDLAWSLPGRAAVFGVPRAVRVPSAVPVVERLAGSAATEWSLTVVAEPVPAQQVLERYSTVCDLRREYGTELSVSRRLSAMETAQTVDPFLSEVDGLLREEQQRVMSSLTRGGFQTQIWLTASDEAVAAGLAGAAVAAVSPRGSAPFPLRALPVVESAGIQPVLLTPDELAGIVVPPVHDVLGFAVREWARFDAEPEAPVRGASDTPAEVVSVGATSQGWDVSYPRQLLTRHACITGMTGSGKSAFVRSLLDGLGGIPYLVIEPTKTEYADDLDARGDVVWRMGDPATTWRLNPCEVPAGTPLSTHIDLLMALLRSTLGLFAPLPFILEMGLRRAYAARGWDARTGVNAWLDASPAFPAFPTLNDVLDQSLGLVESLGYSGEVRDNVSAALHARLGALTSGTKGVVFGTEELFDIESLLSRDAVVNLDLLGNDEEKAFAIGLVLLRILEHRRGRRSRHLRHVTVVEEAHRVFSMRPPSSDELNPSGDFASETLSDMLAEVRSAGEGVLVVDQSPRRLADAALANTSLKVAFRTTFGGDLDRLQSAMNLSDLQRRALVGLSTHEAVVFWEGMDRPMRLTAASRHLSASAADASGAPRQPTISSTIPAGDWLDGLADAWMAADGAARNRIARRMSALLHERTRQPIQPGEMDRVLLATIDRARGEAKERFGRSRLWTLEQRRVPAGGWAAEPPAGSVLRDGSLPFAGCDLVCPDGGCMAREVAARVAASLPVAPATSWLSSGSVIAAGDAVRAQLTSVYGETASDLPPETGPCVVVQTLHDRLPRSQLAAVARAAWPSPGEEHHE